MILYHGSNVEINKIELAFCRPFKDFGTGFYLTTLEEQAVLMAERVSKMYGEQPIVTSFDFDENNLKSKHLNILQFHEPSKEWATFVMNNRNYDFKDVSDLRCNLDNKYDIVFGPIANDDLAALFRVFRDGLLDLENLAKSLEYKKLTNQYSFHTEKAIKLLKKVGAI